MTDVLVNGVARDSIATLDRGLAYGDGVFETVVVEGGDPPFWAFHWDRLKASCRVLGLPCPEQAQLLHDVTTVATSPRCVVKIILTRGLGGRGYRPPAEPRSNLIVQRHAMPERSRSALTVGIAQLRLGRQPALAGLKHLNRLEQVLLQQEIAETDWDDALVCDSDGWLVEASQANLFLLKSGRIFTPLIDQAGVQGVFRNWLETQKKVEEIRLSPAALVSFEAAFIANSVRGIVPIQSIAELAQYDISLVRKFTQTLDLPEYLQRMAS